MPRSLNPGTLSIGGGLANARSVEASSFVHPTQELDGLIAHILDPSRAHQAQAIQVVDTAGNFSSDDVEGALAELAGSAGATGQSGVIVGCTFTSVGLTVTLVTPSTVMINTERDMSGDSAVLTPSAINWLYVHGTTGILSVSVGAAPPSITTPENVLLARIVTGPAAIISFRDARFFVKNLDRKLAYTVRGDGVAADRDSEACFESIDAALLYIENFTVAGSSKKARIIVRGTNTISSTVILPTDNIVFEGEDGASFVTGAVLTPMFEVNGKSRIQFRNLLFVSNHAGSIAIEANILGTASWAVDRCNFSSGAGTWDRAISAPVAVTKVLVRDCVIVAAEHGIRMDDPDQVVVQDVEITETGGAGSTGITMALVPPALTRALVVIRGCEIFGFTGNIESNAHDLRVEDCRLLGAEVGIILRSGSLRPQVVGTTISVSAVDGLVGITVTGCTDPKIVDCTLLNTRGVYAPADHPVGIDVVATSSRLLVHGCLIDGFWNVAGALGHGVRVTGANPDGVVSDTTIRVAQVGIQTTTATGDDFRVIGCMLELVAYGMLLAGSRSVVSACNVQLDSTSGFDGITVTGTDCKVVGVTIATLRAPGSYLVGDDPCGIRATGAVALVVDGCVVAGFLNTVPTPDLGKGINLTGGTSQAVVSGCTIRTTSLGIAVAAGCDDARITGSHVRDCNNGVAMDGSRGVMTGCQVDLSLVAGVNGVTSLGIDTNVSGTYIRNPRVAWAGSPEVPTGVHLTGGTSRVSGCQIVGFRNTFAATGFGVFIPPTGVDCAVSDVTFTGCHDGVTIVSGATGTSVIGCKFDTLANDGVSTDADRCKVDGNTFQNVVRYAIQVSKNTGCSVTGNEVNRVAGVTTTGIYVWGRAVPGDECRDVVISNNTVRSMTTHSILVEGYVRDVVISGNQVDGFVSTAPFDPTVNAGIRVQVFAAVPGSIPTDVAITGTRFNGARTGSSVLGTLADRVDNVTVNGNVVHHCAFAHAGAGPDTFVGAGCKGIGLDFVRSVVVSTNHVHDIGILINNVGVTGAPTAGGPDVEVASLYTRNSTGVGITHNHTLNASPAGVGTATGIFVQQRTSGVAPAGTFATADFRIEGNTVEATPFGAGIRVSVALGGDPVTATHRLDQVVILAGNIVNDTITSGAGILVESGDRSNMRGVSITGNQVYDTAGEGILVNQLTVATPGGSTLNNVIISGNEVEDTGAEGIGVRASNPTRTHDVIIQGNVLRDTTDGIRLFASAGSALTHVSVKDNHIGRINGATVAGVNVVCIDSTVTEWQHFDISGNRITEATAAGQTGILFSTTDVSLSDVRVVDNVVGENSASFAGRGIRFDLNATGVTPTNLDRVLIQGNQLRVSGASGIDVSPEGQVTLLTIADNQVSADSAATRCLDVSPTDPSGAADVYNRDWIVSGNVFKDGLNNRIRILGGHKLRGMKVSGNTFRDTAAEGLVFEITVTGAMPGSDDAGNNLVFSGNEFTDTDDHGLEINLGNAAFAIDPVNNFSVTGNTFRLCATAIAGDNAAVQITTRCGTQNLRVSDNQFDQCGNADNITSGNISLFLGHILLEAATNTVVSGNEFWGGEGPAVLVDRFTSATAWNLSNLEVSENRVNDWQNTAIYVNLAGYGLVAVQVVIRGNTINDVGSGAAEDMGIHVFTPTASTLNGLAIEGNQLRSTDGGGITVTTSATGAVNGLALDHNSVHTVSGGVGIMVSSTTTGLFRNVSVNDNKVYDTSVEGILVSHTGSIVGLAMDRNEIDTAGTDGISLAMTPVGAETLRNAEIDSNKVVDASGFGISVDLDAALTISNLSVSHNLVYDPGTDGININVDVTTPVAGVRVDHNTVEAAQDGIDVFLETTSRVRNFSLSNNAVHDFSAGNIGIRVISTAGAAVSYKGINISDNIMTSGAATVTALWVGFPKDLDGMVVSDNNGQLTGAGSRGFVIDLGVVGVGTDLSFTGNVMRAALESVHDPTGGAPTSSNWPPANSLCVGNISAGPVGFTWTDFSAGFTVSANNI